MSGRSGGSTDSEDEEEEEEEEDEDEGADQAACGRTSPSSFPSPGPQPSGECWMAYAQVYMELLTVLNLSFVHVLSPLPQAQVGLLPLTQCLWMPQQAPQFPRRQTYPLSRSYPALQPTIPHSSGVDGQDRAGGYCSDIWSGRHSYVS